MSKRKTIVRAQPRVHGASCECAICDRRRKPSSGGARGAARSGAGPTLPSLGTDPLARFAKLHDAGREAGKQGKLGFVTLSTDLCAYLDGADGAHARALRAWATLSESEQQVFHLCVLERVTQAVCGQRLNLSQPTISRRLRAAQDALQAVR